MLPLLFSRRYLFSKKSHSVINIISGVSVFAVAMPVAAMIILLSVFNGFEGLIREMASAFDADLTITPREGSNFAVDLIDTASLRDIEGIEAMSFIVEQNAMLEYKGQQASVTVRGVDADYETVLPIHKAVTTGEYCVRHGDFDRAVIGQGMAYSLGVRSLAAGPLNIYALGRKSFSTLIPLGGYKRREVDIAGIFLLDAATEQQYILTSLRLARSLFDCEGRATALIIRTGEQAQPTSLKRRVGEIAGSGFEVRTRYELRSTFYDIMTYEKWGIFFISLLVLLIASFSMVGALSMLILEKRADIRTLRSLGADSRLVRRIFIGEGLLIASLGALLGTLLGVGITLAQQTFGLVEIPVETFLTRSYPVRLEIADLLAVIGAFAAVALIITWLTVSNMIPKTSDKL